ncbi:MAG: hypothetical protein M1838_000357 [Thelocarpon superellum]|nr:MAG: hypothetical protein M1838_000357 [Thelocarpon superellum]
MVKTSVLNDALNSINNAEKAGKRQVLIRPSSKVIVKFLSVMQKHGYIGEFEEVDDHRNGKIVIQLNGRLNKTGVISPRYNVRLADLEKWVVKLLPSRQFGYIVLTTSAGIMDHEEARRKHVAGKFRSNWVVDPQTGTYSSNVRSPTNIASDPPLAGYGEEQARALALHLRTLDDPPIERIYSSPYYRCLQTIAPTVRLLQQSQPPNPTTLVKIRAETGLGEWYGRASFPHPGPATPSLLLSLFPDVLSDSYIPLVTPPTHGESIDALHDRAADTLERVIAALDAEEGGPRAVLMCTHAATLIAAGRVLTGYMPSRVDEKDFRPFTCGLSKFKRGLDEEKERGEVDWRNGKGVAGGWDCVKNGDCTFLAGGEERGWYFTGDEAFDTSVVPEPAPKSTSTTNATAAVTANGTAEHGPASRL